MRRVFPDLPKTAAQAIWSNTSAAERLHMHNHSGMPRQMPEEALVALRDVRLARACEGLYLDSVFSADSERLALKMMGHLAGWPSKIRIEIRHGVPEGNISSAIGDSDSPVRHLLIRQDEGYVILDSDNLIPQGSKGLSTAVWLLLQPAQRQLLGVTDGGGAALQRLLRAQPLPSRQDVSEWLGLAPLPVSFVAAQYIPVLRGLFVGLLGNPLSDVSKQRINQYLENSSLDRKLEVQTEDVVSESDSESESSESGFSTGSDSD
jgi:hypothetical protein